MMRKIALLRGVTPTGKNRIPKMSYLAEIMEQAGLKNVQTYIQSGNIIFNTELFDSETSALIHKVILEKIGADLSVIIKHTPQLETAIRQNPFAEGYDYSRIHLVFTNDTLNRKALENLLSTDYGAEKLCLETECLYMYLPKNSKRKVLSTNYLEKHLGITATMRKLSVITALSQM